MLRAKMSTIASLVVFAWMPAIAEGQTGACGIPGGEGDEALCIDGLTQQQCDVLGFEFFPNEVCTNAEIPWDGACDQVSSPIGQVCALLFAPPNGFTAEELCSAPGDSLGGVWLGAGSVCPLVASALPKVGIAVLAVALLAGSLMMLRKQARSRGI